MKGFMRKKLNIPYDIYNILRCIKIMNKLHEESKYFMLSHQLFMTLNIETLKVKVNLSTV